MPPTRSWTLLIVALIGLVLLASGCTSPAPAPTPQPTPDPAMQTPEEAVIGFWSDIDSGRYADAYGLAYHEQNVSFEDWISDHEAIYGAGGSDLQIYSFAVSESFPVSPETFGGNFSAAQVIVVDTRMAYRGENRTGTVQFPAVKVKEGWKIYGDY